MRTILNSFFKVDFKNSFENSNLPQDQIKVKKLNSVSYRIFETNDEPFSETRIKNSFWTSWESNITIQFFSLSIRKKLF